MPKSIIGGISITVILAALLAGTAHAQIYKCTDADGGTVYAQTPCSTTESTTVRTGTSGGNAADCTYANKFASWTARLMRGGSSSKDVFDRYGGIGALSKESLGVINYVYTFRTNDDVTVERIASLAAAKCRAGSFGTPSCEALPAAYTDGLGGCDAEDDATEAGTAPDFAPAAPITSQPTQNSSATSAARAITPTRSREDVEQCKKPYRDRIDAIDAQMRRGYTSEQGESYRQSLRGLTQSLRDCE